MSRELEKFDDDELRKELEDRRNKQVFPPAPRDKPDYTQLKKVVADGIEQMLKDRYEDEDFQHYVYEAAIEAIYGPEYWTWRRGVKFLN